MIATIVGCGSSASNWIPNGISYGSNDCEKFGEPVDVLILANGIHKFGDRIKIIKKHQGEVLVTAMKQWSAIFPQAKSIKYTSFVSHIRKGLIYSARTTPIMCMSIAINRGATELVLYGIDMLDHHTYKKGTKHGNHEIATYLKFFKACERIGVKVWLGAKGTAFDTNLKLYENNSIDSSFVVLSKSADDNRRQ